MVKVLSLWPGLESVHTVATYESCWILVFITNLRNCTTTKYISVCCTLLQKVIIYLTERSSANHLENVKVFSFDPGPLYLPHQRFSWDGEKQRLWLYWKHKYSHHIVYICPYSWSLIMFFLVAHTVILVEQKVLFTIKGVPLEQNHSLNWRAENSPYHLWITASFPVLYFYFHSCLPHTLRGIQSRQKHCL